MTQEELTMIKDEIRGSHDALSDQITELKKQIDPITTVYQSFKGFGNVAMGIFKWVIVPLSVIVGVILSFKKLFH